MAKKLVNKSINILGHSYQLKYVDKKKLGDEAIGICIFEDKEIWILKDLKGELLFRTVLHEIFHAYQYEAGDTQLLHPQVQEKNCDMFAGLIVSLKKQKIL